MVESKYLVRTIGLAPGKCKSVREKNKAPDAIEIGSFGAGVGGGYGGLLLGEPGPPGGLLHP